MKNFHLVLLVLIVTMAIIPSCNKPSVIGGELLEQDQLDIVFTDTVSIVAKTVKADSILMYAFDEQLDNYLCGDLDDPIFGGVKAVNYVQNRLSFSDPGFLTTDKIDSVVLSIVYDSTTMYGNFGEEHTIKVYRLLDDLSSVETYYSNDQFEFDPTPIGTHTFTPSFDSVFVTSYYNDILTENMLVPMVRIPIELSYGQEIFNSQDSVFVDDINYLEVFKGLYIESEGANKESLLSFQYRNIFSNLHIYYTRDDTLNRQYDFLFSNSSVKTVSYDHYGLDASSVGPFIEDTTLGDSLLFVQGMQGPNINFKFPHIESLEDLVINRATLELTVATLPGDDTELFSPVQQFLLSTVGEDGELTLIDDVVFASSANSALFGGDLTTDETLNIQTYSLNMSTVLQNMVFGNVPNEVVLTIDGSAQRANRTAVFGPSHSVYPAKLNITYTDN